MKKKRGKEKSTEVIFVFEMHHPFVQSEYLEIYKKYGPPDVVGLELSQETVEKLKNITKNELDKLVNELGIGGRLEPHMSYKQLMTGEGDLLKNAIFVGLDPYSKLAFSWEDVKEKKKELKVMTQILSKKDFERYYNWLAKRDDAIIENIKKLVVEHHGKRIYVHLGYAHHIVYEKLAKELRSKGIKVREISLQRQFFSKLGYPKNVRAVYPVQAQLYRLIRYGRLNELEPEERERVIRSYIKEIKKYRSLPFTVGLTEEGKLFIELDKRFFRPWGKKSWMLLQELRKKPKSRKKGFFERLKEKFSRRSRARK